MQLNLALFTILVVVVWATAVTLVPVATRIVAEHNRAKNMWLFFYVDGWMDGWRDK